MESRYGRKALSQTHVVSKDASSNLRLIAFFAIVEIREAILPQKFNAVSLVRVEFLSELGVHLDLANNDIVFVCCIPQEPPKCFSSSSLSSLQFSCWDLTFSWRQARHNSVPDTTSSEVLQFLQDILRFVVTRYGIN